jgi:hypothetical protein
MNAGVNLRPVFADFVADDTANCGTAYDAERAAAGQDRAAHGTDNL